VSAQLYCGDCLEFMRTLPAGSVAAVITDPPYGCGKADWDAEFPTAWYAEARRIARRVVIITGPSGLVDSVPLVGADFVDVIAAWNKNGMTRSPLGFGNWLAAVVAGEKPKQTQTFFSFVVADDMPNHPSPKPLRYMRGLLPRVSEQGDTVLDCFMGSGTTGVACVQTGRNFIGVEIDPTYYAIAERRIREAEQQPALALVE